MAELQTAFFRRALVKQNGNPKTKQTLFLETHNQNHYQKAAGGETVAKQQKEAADHVARELAIERPANCRVYNSLPGENLNFFFSRKIGLYK